MFWGEILKDEEIVNLKSTKKRVLHISHATLVRRGDKDKVCIQLSDGINAYVIGKLIANHSEFINLDYNLTLNKSSVYSINLVNGVNTEVHISGYFQSEEESIETETPFEEVINKSTIIEIPPVMDEIKEDLTKSLENETQLENENPLEEKAKIRNDKKAYLYASDDEVNEEIDRGVDNDKLNKFLNRKIGKEEENSGKKLKKLAQMKQKFPEGVGSKIKPLIKNIVKIAEKPVINNKMVKQNYNNPQKFNSKKY